MKLTGEPFNNMLQDLSFGWVALSWWKEILVQTCRSLFQLYWWTLAVVLGAQRLNFSPCERLCHRVINLLTKRVASWAVESCWCLCLLGSVTVTCRIWAEGRKCHRTCPEVFHDTAHCESGFLWGGARMALKCPETVSCLLQLNSLQCPGT